MIGDYRKAVALTGRRSSAENNNNSNSDLQPEAGVAEAIVRSDSKVREAQNVQTAVFIALKVS